MQKTLQPVRFVETPGAHCSAAFTRVDLRVVLAVISLLATTVLPGVTRTRLASQGQTCLENARQLVRALLLYSADCSDYLPPNPDDGTTLAYRAWVSGQAGRGGAQEFNPDVLTDPTRSLLALYLNREAAVFRCPDDLRVGLYQGANPDLRGKTVPAARSYSMNVAIGTNPYRAGGKQPTDGAWLDGQHAHRANQIWFTFARTSDLRNPGPARTFVFLDEDYRSINDGLFALVGPYPGRQNYRMLDYPSSCHDGGGSFAFADGHVESHRWRDARTRLLGPGPPISQSQPGNVDIVWLAEHATALVRQPQLTAVGIAAGNTFQIALPALNGARYVLEYKDCLSATGWTALPAVTATNAGLLQLVDPGATSAQRFYRAWTP